MNFATVAILAMASLILAALFIAGCTGPDTAPEASPPAEKTPDMTPPPGSPANGQESVVAANNQFALDLYTHLAEDPEYSGENIFFSPFSISSALAITYEGARGETAREIQEVFAFPGDIPTMREGYLGIIAGINSGTSAYSLRMANALWAEETYPFLPEYITIADRTYGAKTTNLGFITNPDTSRLIINQWIEEQTEEKIKDLIPAGSITPLTRLVITNAIYFKGTWVKQFDEEKTTVEDFRTGTGVTVQIPMMQRTDRNATYGYTETRHLQVLQMPYESDSGKQLSMLVLLPKDGNLATLEQSLDANTLPELQQNLTKQQVMVYFPKFTMETKYSLPRTLSAMGMPTAFTGSADFSGMDGTGSLYIADVIHQAFVDVNEEGTEAAAATAVIIMKSSAPAEEQVPVFRADHPFIFIIRDDETGLILFMGRVEHPVST
jgi:serpin B